MVQSQVAPRYRIFPRCWTHRFYVSSFWFCFNAVWDTCAAPLPTNPNVFKSDKFKGRKPIHTLDQYCSYYTFNYIWTPSETKRNTVWIKDAKSTRRERGKNLCMSIPGNSKSSKSKATCSMQEVTRVVLSRCDVKQAETLHTAKNCGNIGWIKS